MSNAIPYQNLTHMAQFKSLELSMLVAMLSDFTIYYTEMLTKGANKDNIESCKYTMQLLQSEIDFREGHNIGSPVFV